MATGARPIPRGSTATLATPLLALALATACGGDSGGSGDGDDDGLPGDPDDPAAEAIPDDPCVADMAGFSDDHPELPGVMISFNQAIVVFEPGTTVGEVNDVLGRIGAAVQCGIPGRPDTPVILVVRTPTDDHDEMIAALEQVSAGDKVRRAKADILLVPTVVSRPNGGAPADWSWDDPPRGGNWGLEHIRMPAAWNLVSSAQADGAAIQVDVIDRGYPSDGSHPDLGNATLANMRGDGDHGAHVAGTIAATFDNGIGVDGVNPFATLTLRLAGTWSEVIGAIYSAKNSGAQVMNLSLGYGWSKANGGKGIDTSADTDPAKAARSRAQDDGSDMNDTMEVIEDLATGTAPMLVVAAGNDSDAGFGKQDAVHASPMANAALREGLRNIVVVESVDTDGKTRSSFSNVGGHVSGPGRDVSSTLVTGYGTKSGTSMATPHVAGLISYLYAVIPDLPLATLSTNDVVAAMMENTTTTADGGAGLIDAYATLIQLGGDDVIRRLSDVDDGTMDGNDRGVTNDGPPDGTIDMADFRRFRDAVLQVEDDPSLALDGPADHPKKDLDHDTEVGTAAEENVYPRFDLNGDGKLSRADQAALPGLGMVTDLDVLALQFEDENHTKDELADLLSSGDVKIDATSCIDRFDTASVRITISADSGAGYDEMRDHEGSTPVQIYTLPTDAYTIEAQALGIGGSVITTVEHQVDLALGEDETWTVSCGGTPEGLAVGLTHSCAIGTGGQVYCWGSNTRGQVGDGTTMSPMGPVAVMDLDDATSIAASGAHSCATRLDGTAACWGYNDAGQLGDGSQADSPVPVAVAGISDVVEIAAGGSDMGLGFTCARTSTGEVWCWGANLYGQLGAGDCASVCAPGTNAWSPGPSMEKATCQACTSARTPSSTPRQTSITGATALSAGLRHMCAIGASGTLMCWGYNVEGQLGVRGQEATIMLTTDDPQPVCMVFDDALMPPCQQTLDDAVAVSAGNAHTCAVRSDGTPLCWGFQGSDGRLGDGSLLVQLTPVPVMGVADARDIAAGGNHTCAVTNSGTGHCWGWNNIGQLGNGNNMNSTSPVMVLMIDDATIVDVGVEHSCSLRASGSLACWGRHAVGSPTLEPVEIPIP